MLHNTLIWKKPSHAQPFAQETLFLATIWPHQRDFILQYVCLLFSKSAKHTTRNNILSHYQFRCTIWWSKYRNHWLLKQIRGLVHRWTQSVETILFSLGFVGKPCKLCGFCTNPLSLLVTCYYAEDIVWPWKQEKWLTVPSNDYLKQD